MDRNEREYGGSILAPRTALAVVSALAVLLFVIALALAAFDVLVVLLLVGAIVLFERTIGDWLADELGSAAGKVILAALVVVVLWGSLGTAGGRTATQALLRSGAERGFNTAFVSVDVPASMRGRPSRANSTSSAAAAPLTSPSPSTGRPTSAAAPTGRPVGAAPSAGRPTSAAAGASSSTAVSAGNAGPAVAADVAGGGSVGNPRDAGRPAEPANTRLTVSATPIDEGQRVLLKAAGTTGPNHVPDGVVEFSLNGRVVAKVPLRSDGTAEATMANLRPGSYLVAALYVGTSDFRDSSSETTFTM